MIRVLVEENGETLGDMRITATGPGSRPDSKNYDIEYAAESGSGWIDLRQRTLYAFPDKYNTLALVGAALDLLDYDEMEMTDATDPRHLARGLSNPGKEVSRKALDSKRDHRPPFWRRQSE